MYLKDINNEEFDTDMMVSVWMDMVPDEVHKELSQHHLKPNSEPALEQLLMEVDKITNRE